ncbi:hypothetical protein BU16DRAFT_523905 [Lophium mytilinum]|uniref:Uncharacterized protein n=1 Tax=Lophium mytilinum TaxID=390894 RepID=A0A6A6R512_9PEZI|nr:hypothetical protein BU16DRAFT_523905 [Lophium mytilinum]
MKFAEKQLHTKLYRSNFSAEGFADVINAGYHCEPSPIYEDVKAIALAHYKELWNNDGFQMAIEARTLPGRFMRDYMSKIGGRWLDTKNEGLLAVEDSRDTEAERKGTKRKDLP